MEVYPWQLAQLTDTETAAAQVTVFAIDGASAAAGPPVAAETDAEGRFRIERMPRLGVQLTCKGSGCINHEVALEDTSAPEDLRIVMLRRCHVKVELADPAWASGTIRFLDANNAVLPLVEQRARTIIMREVFELRDGKTDVLAVSESAVQLVVATGDGQREQRLPIALRAGDVQVIR